MHDCRFPSQFDGDSWPGAGRGFDPGAGESGARPSSTPNSSPNAFTSRHTPFSAPYHGATARIIVGDSRRRLCARGCSPTPSAGSHCCGCSWRRLCRRTRRGRGSRWWCLVCAPCTLRSPRHHSSRVTVCGRATVHLRRRCCACFRRCRRGTGGGAVRHVAVPRLSRCNGGMVEYDPHSVCCF
jgi:hypothetical protein